MTRIQTARFAIGQIVRHRDDAFRGVVMDVDHAYEG
ncbi:hemimethylated DNA-binding YccV-like domain-containing protein, partial [Rhizobium johnstonii]